MSSMALSWPAAMADLPIATKRIGRALRSVCDRVGRRRGDDPSGTFPRADFLDTRIDTVVHKKTVWDARTLAQVIPARAELLLSTERNF